jgi:glycosyltransferase involved in cell wall biosynthesis
MIPKLTIVIPTYNRAQLLKQRLEELVPQVAAHSNVELYVLDDASTDETPQVLEPYRKRLTGHERVEVNLGIGRSMLRAFESVRGGWLWTLGDDDPAGPEAVATALELIGKSPEALAINCDSEGGRNSQDQQVYGLGEFLAGREIADILFMSSNLYNLDALAPYRKVFCQAVGTLAPHLALLLAALEDGRRPLVFSTRQLTLFHHREQRWSSLEAALGLVMMPVYIKDAELQRQVACSARRVTRWMLRYGLREVKDAADFQRWKRLATAADGLLAAHGAGFLNDFKPAKDDRALLLRLAPGIIRWCPYWLVRRLASRMRQAHAGGTVLLDNHVTVPLRA